MSVLRSRNTLLRIQNLKIILNKKKYYSFQCIEYMNTNIVYYLIAYIFCWMTHYFTSSVSSECYVQAENENIGGLKEIKGARWTRVWSEQFNLECKISNINFFGMK